MKKTTICLLVAMGLPSLAFAHSAGDVLVRTGAITVAPDDSSDDVLGLGEFSVDKDTQLGLTVGYMVTDNIGIELLAATPFSHNIALPGVGNLAKTRHLPPSLMAQYYFGNKNSMWRPYIGVGVNYTTFFHEKFTNDLGGALTNLKLKDSWGVAGQVGMDFVFNKNFIVNGSVWWMDIDTKAKFDYLGERQSIKTHIDPWVYMMSVGYRF